MELLGWISAISLSLCGIPQAWRAYKTKTVEGLSDWFIISWSLGEILGVIYVISIGSWPLIVNYFVNLIACIVLVKYRYFNGK